VEYKAHTEESLYVSTSELKSGWMYVVGLATALLASQSFSQWGRLLEQEGPHRSTRVITTEYWPKVGLSVISDAAMNSLLDGS